MYKFNDPRFFYTRVFEYNNRDLSHNNFYYFAINNKNIVINLIILLIIFINKINFIQLLVFSYNLFCTI